MTDINKTNNLIPYSLGIAAMNKELNSTVLTVYPISTFPMVDGEVTDHVEEYVAEYIDSRGARHRTVANTTVTIKANWMSQDPNVMTAPDVRRGAKVQIWRETNTPYFYWSTITNTDNHQKLETRVVGYSNTQDESQSATMENTWTQGVSTHEKKVNLIHTTKSDGEKWAYDINVDAKAGTVNVQDDIGNYIRLVSGQNQIRLESAAGAFIEIIGEDINIKCRKLNIQADQSIEETSPNKQGSYSSGWNTNSPNHGHTGNYTIAGGISAGPGSYGSGMVMTGDFNHIGTMTSTGDHVIGGISYLGHRHNETQSVTGTPI